MEYNQVLWHSSHYEVTHVLDKNSNIQGRSPNVAKVISMLKETALNAITALKGKNSPPLGANSFL